MLMFFLFDTTQQICRNNIVQTLLSFTDSLNHFLKSLDSSHVSIAKASNHIESPILISTRDSATSAIAFRNQTFNWDEMFTKTIFISQYEPERVSAVGPDRACAEWLLRCGGGVVWKGSQTVFKDYNSLPRTSSRSTKIMEIDGTDSCIMIVGFEYLKGLTELRKVKLKNAT